MSETETGETTASTAAGDTAAGELSAITALGEETTLSSSGEPSIGDCAAAAAAVSFTTTAAVVAAAEAGGSDDMSACSDDCFSTELNTAGEGAELVSEGMNVAAEIGMLGGPDADGVRCMPPPGLATGSHVAPVLPSTLPGKDCGMTGPGAELLLNPPALLGLMITPDDEEGGPLMFVGLHAGFDDPGIDVGVVVVAAE